MTAVNKQQALKTRQPQRVGEHVATNTLDGSTTAQVLEISMVAEKVSVQSSGSLAGNIEFSVNGVDFFDSTAFVANTPVSYSTHHVKAVRVTRTGGTGKLHLAAR